MKYEVKPVGLSMMEVEADRIDVYATYSVLVKDDEDIYVAPHVNTAYISESGKAGIKSR
tara:strand:- start:46597 stop:46773 length:177 start_codon:yes stop_codon:yes gene_type:complete